MKAWSVNGIVSGGKFLGTVHARTEEEAKTVAWDSLDCDSSLCHQCANECEDAQILELDVYLEAGE